MRTTIPQNVFDLCLTLKANGFEAYVVGGAIRDALLGLEAHDWDLATNATPTEVIGCFDKVVPTGIKYGTVTVVVDSNHYEITTYRADSATSDGRRPDSVTFSKSIEEDLSRRDFTVNAMAYDPITDTLVDPFKGFDDLLIHKTLRCVGDPLQRFSEDGLRLLRAVRFAAKYNLTLGDQMFTAMSNSTECLNLVSCERVRDELLKILACEAPGSVQGAFHVLAFTGLLGKILPEMLPMIGCTQNKYHEFDVFRHTLEVVEACPADPILRLAALFHDVSKPTCKGVHPKTGDATFYEHEDVGTLEAEKILKRLCFSSAEISKVTHLIKNHLVMYETHWTDSAVRRWARTVGPENIDDLLALAIADIKGKGNAMSQLDVDRMHELKHRVETQAEVIVNTSTLAIDGNVVMSLGVPQGAKVGKILTHLKEAVLENPELNTIEALTLIAQGLINDA